MTGSEVPPAFRLAYVPGVTPAKWVRIWHERLPDVPLTLTQVPPAQAADLLRGLDADAGFVRLPIDRTDLSAIPLYTEATVVVVPKDHLLAAADEVTAADLAEEVVLHPFDDTLGWERPPGLPALERPAATADAVELVAAGVGLLVVPQSLARLHHRRDLTYRPLTDAPGSQVALSWREDTTTDLVEEFIGIVRGRTVNSTRGRGPTPPQPKGRRAEAAGGAAGRNPRGGAQKGAAKGGGKAAGKAGGRGGTPRNTPKGAPKGAKRGKPRRP
ncbi:LysR family substrate-binding domain-containing protein [Streptomyces sp. V4-01]|uniref:LysR family substrate-binding domain-containing protein n=1 Tax=Actinacidiphila polyblastidii TaxID=3110430 RepID=A0ABU7PCB9_9ACTN|nr:LysR family substrate-binding domain-containing protein [Streptomyces sp. V4-01]